MFVYSTCKNLYSVYNAVGRPTIKKNPMLHILRAKTLFYH